MLMKAVFSLLKAAVFAQTALEQGYKFKRAVTNLQAALDNLMKYLTENEIRMLFRKVDRLGKGVQMSMFDYYDCLSEAIETLKNTRFRYLNSIIALAANVEEIEE